MPVKRIKMKNIQVRNAVVLLLSLVIASCASTSITQSWKKAELKKTYQHPMVIGISDSQQTRRIFENYLVEELKNRNITATPSYMLISSKQTINRETVLGAIKGTEIDSTLVTYLVSVDSEMKYHDSPLNGGYSGKVDNNMMSSTLITNRGRYSSEEIIGLKNDFYDVQTKSLVWSVQTKTVAAKSIDQIIVDVSQLLVKELFDDGIFK